MADRTRKKNPRNIIGLPCLVNIAYWRRETSVRQYIGAQMPPAPLLMAHRTQKIDKLVRYEVYIKITYWRAEQKEADRTTRCAAPIFIPITY